jgi:hypothetical protein
MGLAYRQQSDDKFRTVGGHAALENCRRQLFRVRLELAELKRTGSRQGLAALSSDAVMLSMQIKRLETLLRQGQKETGTTADAKLLVFSR